MVMGAPTQWMVWWTQTMNGVIGRHRLYGSCTLTWLLVSAAQCSLLSVVWVVLCNFPKTWLKPWIKLIFPLWKGFCAVCTDSHNKTDYHRRCGSDGEAGEWLWVRVLPAFLGTPAWSLFFHYSVPNQHKAPSPSELCFFFFITCTIKFPASYGISIEFACLLCRKHLSPVNSSAGGKAMRR